MMVNQDFKDMLVNLYQKHVKTYSVTELEMTGLALNIHLWKHLLLRVEFDCAVDHRALPYIMKSNNLPKLAELLGYLNIYQPTALTYIMLKEKA